MSAPAVSLSRCLLRQLLLPRAAVVLGWLAAAHWLALPKGLVLALIAADALLLLWQARAVLRGTDAHVASTGAMASVWGSYLLVLLAIFAAPVLWWEALLSTREEAALPYAEQRRQEREALYRLTLSEDGSTLVLEGEITHGLTRRIEAQLAAAPDLRRLQLSSAGGLIYEARGTARLIAQYRLDTEAAGLCASACTLIFAAGHSRRLAPDGALGFHGYGLMFPGGLPQVNLIAEQQRDLEFLQQQGIHADFARRALATDHRSLWRPTLAELLAAGVVTQSGR